MENTSQTNKHDQVPRYTAVVQPLLSSEFDHQSFPKILWTHLHHLPVRFLQFSTDSTLNAKQYRQTAAADLLPHESHAAANVSLLARLQKLSTETFKQKMKALL